MSQKSILNKPQFTTRSVTHFEHRIVKGNSSTRIVSFFFFLFEMLLGIDFKRVDNTFEMNKNKIILRYSPPEQDPPKSVADVIRRRPWFFVLILALVIRVFVRNPLDRLKKKNHTYCNVLNSNYIILYSEIIMIKKYFVYKNHHTKLVRYSFTYRHLCILL